MIYVITHKKFDDSIFDKNIYRVLHVGKNDSYKSDYLRDDVGDNISEKNPSYCELTGLYWIWKNVNFSNNDAVGLIHYRRFFTNRKYNFTDDKKKVSEYSITKEDIDKYLNRADIILPQKKRTFFNVRKQYYLHHDKSDILLTENIIKEIYPEYLSSFDKVMNGNKFYYANMMITRKKLFDDYCEWLFNIFDRLEPKIDMSKYEDSYQRRVFGFLSERLLNVWVCHNNLSVKELPVYCTEKTSSFLKKRSVKNMLFKIKRKIKNGA